MTVVGLAWKSLRQRLLSTCLTATCVALGVGLVVLVVTARESARSSFGQAARGYDVVLGGMQTAPLTTVLSTVFFLDQPRDRIGFETYEAVKKDPRVRYAVPYAVGDVCRGFRVVGTTPDLFDALSDASRPPVPLRSRIAPGGRVFGTGDEFEAVVGAVAAARAGLPLGERFQVTHGLEAGGHRHDELWTVVGVLEPTGTPIDRAIFITLGSFFRVKGHERHDGDEKHEGEHEGEKHDDGMHDEGMDDDGMHEGEKHEGEEDHDHDATAPWAVSSIVIRLTSPAARDSFFEDMRSRSDLRPARPDLEIPKLFAMVENVDLVFRGVGLLVIVVSGMSILVGLYNTIQGRRREIAILRALGARPAHVFSVVVLESVLMCVAGGVVGLLLGHGAVAALSPRLLEEWGVRVSAAPAAFDAWVLAGALAMGFVAGALPAWRAFRSPVARYLHPQD